MATLDQMVDSLAREWKRCRRGVKFDDGTNDLCVDDCPRCERVKAYRGRKTREAAQSPATKAARAQQEAVAKLKGKLDRLTVGEFREASEALAKGIIGHG